LPLKRRLPGGVAKKRPAAEKTKNEAGGVASGEEGRQANMAPLNTVCWEGEKSPSCRRKVHRNDVGGYYSPVALLFNDHGQNVHKDPEN